MFTIRTRTWRYVSLRALTVSARKSQTALEYCWRFSADHPEFHVFWIYAGSVARFDADYRQLARRIGVDCHDGIPISDVRGGVKDWLNTHDKWLMVIDNADSYSDFFGVEENDEGNLIQTALPWPRPSEAMMVYTSRHARIGAQLTAQDCLQLEVMSESDGIAMFRRKFRRSVSDEETVKLLTALEFLPLSIAHAAAYLKFTGIPVDAYLSRIEGSDEGLLDMLGQSVDVGRQAHTSVVTTWKASFDLIRKHNRAAADLFCLIACLDHQNIPEDLISVITDAEFAQMVEARRQQGFEIILPLTQGDRWTAIAELSSLALLTRGGAMGGSTLSLHRYVRATTVRHLQDEGNLLAFSLSAAEGLIIALQSNWKKLELVASCEGSGNDLETQLSSVIPHVCPSVLSVHALLGVTAESLENCVLQYGYRVRLWVHLCQFALYTIQICCRQYGVECLAGIDLTDFINISAACDLGGQRLLEIQCLYSEVLANCTSSNQQLRRPKKKRSAGIATTTHTACTHSLPDQ